MSGGLTAQGERRQLRDAPCGHPGRLGRGDRDQLPGSSSASTLHSTATATSTWSSIRTGDRIPDRRSDCSSYELAVTIKAGLGAAIFKKIPKALLPSKDIYNKSHHYAEPGCWQPVQDAARARGRAPPPTRSTWSLGQIVRVAGLKTRVRACARGARVGVNSRGLGGSRSLRQASSTRCQHDSRCEMGIFDKAGKQRQARKRWRAPGGWRGLRERMRGLSDHTNDDVPRPHRAKAAASKASARGAGRDRQRHSRREGAAQRLDLDGVRNHDQTRPTESPTRPRSSSRCSKARSTTSRRASPCARPRRP